MAETSETLLAAINMLQVVALAWIASRQVAVKKELERVNGDVTGKLDAIKAQLPPAKKR